MSRLFDIFNLFICYPFHFFLRIVSIAASFTFTTKVALKKIATKCLSHDRRFNAPCRSVGYLWEKISEVCVGERNTAITPHDK